MMFQAECTAIPPELPRIVIIKLVGRCDSSALLLFYFVFAKDHPRGLMTKQQPFETVLFF